MSHVWDVSIFYILEFQSGVYHPVQSFNILDLDDTDGADLHSHLKLMWNTLRDKVKTNWFLYKSITGNQSPQVTDLPETIQYFFCVRCLLSICSYLHGLG